MAPTLTDSYLHNTGIDWPVVIFGCVLICDSCLFRNQILAILRGTSEESLLYTIAQI